MTDFRTVEERLGQLSGILARVPEDIDKLFGLIHQTREEIVSSKAANEATLESIERRLNLIEKSAQSMRDSRMDLDGIKEFIKEQKASRSFWKKHMATTIIGILSAVATAILISYLTGK